MLTADNIIELPVLTHKLGRKRDRLAFLLRRLTGFGAPGGMPPSLFGKFRILLGQIAVAREQESRIRHRIEMVEQQHRYCLAHHQLEQAALAHQDDQPDSDFCEKTGRPGHGLLRFLVLWHLFVRNAINQKKQDLTVD